LQGYDYANNYDLPFYDNIFFEIGQGEAVVVTPDLKYTASLFQLRRDRFAADSDANPAPSPSPSPTPVADVQAPIVSITAPANGSTVLEGKRLR